MEIEPYYTYPDLTAQSVYLSRTVQQCVIEDMPNELDFIQLYDELKVKCHPDRFPTDKEKNTIAENIFQEISKNKNNVKRLLELKEEASQKLNINF